MPTAMLLKRFIMSYICVLTLIQAQFTCRGSVIVPQPAINPLNAATRRPHARFFCSRFLPKCGQRVHAAAVRRLGLFRSSVLASAFVDAAAGSFVDGKRTGLSGYIFREMAGKVSTLSKHPVLFTAAERVLARSIALVICASLMR